MELREALEKRASVRQFTEEPVKVDDLREMVRLAGLAPSANNSQPWRFIAITNRDVLKEMGALVQVKVAKLLANARDDSAKAIAQVEWYSTFFANAPAVVAVASRPYEAVMDEVLPFLGLTHDEINAARGYPDVQSIGASIENLLLAAVDMGYAGCWLSGPLVAREDLEKCLNLPQPWKLAAMAAIGKPAVPTKQKEKKPLEEIFELRV